MTGAIRRVEIAARSARDELISVIRAAMAVTAIVWIYLANDPFPSAGGVVQRNLLPYQAVIQSRPSDEQLMFRELQVALIEAEGARSAKGAWPEPDGLAADGIEPFAANPAVKRTRYRWRLLRNGLFINYIGIPADASAPAWMLLVQEPDPSGQPEPFVDDEDHDRLLDGSVLHVSIWNHSQGGKLTAASVTRAPQAEGWTQLYAAAKAER